MAEQQTELAFQDLQRALAGEEGHVVLRWHAKRSRSFQMTNGRLEASTDRRREGTSVRVLDHGAFGFASCNSHEVHAVKAAIDEARSAARKSAESRRELVQGLAEATLARGHFAEPGIAELLQRPSEAHVELVRAAEETARQSSAQIGTASATYNEIIESRAIVSTDGAACTLEIARPEFRVTAVATAGSERQSASRMSGVTGGWDCLFRSGDAQRLSEEAAKSAVDLLAVGRPKGGRTRVILSPAIVGLLVHEAIGHTVEADFVLSGSVANGKLGQMVASELVTLCDSGQSEYLPGAGGCLPVDDEGVPTERTVILKAGRLVSYLHDRESALRFGVRPTGSARAWEYSDRPLIRMRNTYIEPGQDDLETMVGTLDDGYILEGARNGQADATGEFMFHVERATRVQKGKRTGLLRGVTIAGQAFEVLRSVDAVSREFAWDLGSGYCGKGQPAKVDAGGPWLRCEVILGGDQ